MMVVLINKIQDFVCNQIKKKKNDFVKRGEMSR